MSKFVIECPNCGKYAEASSGLFGSGLFGTKRITCSCRYTFDVKTNKLASRKCAHCGNEVVFDQSKGNSAVCPVCREKINQQSDMTKVEEFEGDNETLVWKHPIEDFNLGSQLIVHESQEAIFFRDGQALDLFGAGRYTLETQQLPILEKIYKLPTDTDGTFHSEVYFVNQTTQMGIKWGTDSKVRLFDPASGMHIEIGASGEFNIRVTDSRKLLMKLVGTVDGMKQDSIFGGKGSKGFFRSMIMTRVKTFLAQTIKDNGYNILEIDYRLQELSDSLRERINADIAEYGLTMPGFFVNNVMTPDDDKNFQRMKQQYADQYLKVREEEIKRKEAEAAAERKYVEAQTAARLKMIGAQAEAEAYRMQAEAEAMEMKMKGYTYQQETARQVGLEAMKNGITGEGYGGAAGGLGDIAGLGVSLGAMGGVMNMTREAMAPMLDTTQQIGQGVVSAASDTWDCRCGNKGIKGIFCNMCGAQKPQPKPDGVWDCACGNKGIIGKFCNMCGSPRPEEMKNDTWDCICGNKGIIGKFCNMCGKPKPQKDTWDCACGNKNIIGKFCNLCGSPRPEPEPATWDCTCGNKGITGMFCDNCGKRKGE